MGVTNSTTSPPSGSGSRNARSVDLEDQRLVASLWAGARCEADTARKRGDAARASAGVCGECGAVLGEDDTVFRARRYDRYVPMCEGCAPRWMVERSWVPAKVIPATHTYEWECAGGCGRTVVFGATANEYRKRIFCSDACRERYHRRARTKAPTEREKTCEVCGESFTASRRDAKTCSPACRQKAYRQRVRV